jgi:HAMP domain-containing protein
LEFIITDQLPQKFSDLKMPNQKSATAFSRFSSLRVRVLLFIAVLIFPLLLVLLYFSNAYRNIIIQELRGDALQLTRSIADVQEHHINGSRQFLLLLSQLPIIREQNWEACNTFYLEIFPAYRETYTNIGYIDVEGNLKCSVLLPEDSVNLSDQSWYQKVRDTREFAIGNYLISVLNNKLVVPLGMPVFSYDGEWIGVVGVALSLEWLNDLIAETPLPEYGVLTITDVNGIILARQAHREERGRLRGVGEQLRDMHVFEEIKQLGEGTIERELRGEQQFVGFSSIGEGDSRLHIILTVPQEIVFAPSAELEKISFLFLGVVMVLSLLIGVLGSQVLIVSAVDRLVAATIKLTQGDLSTRVENISGISEFQILANNFNHMVSALQERDAALRRSERKFRDIFDHAFQFMALLTICPVSRLTEPHTNNL